MNFQSDWHNMQILLTILLNMRINIFKKIAKMIKSTKIQVCILKAKEFIFIFYEPFILLRDLNNRGKELHR